MSDLRTKLIRLAYTNPAIQPHLVPILKEARSWATQAFYSRMREGYATWLVMVNNKIEFAKPSNMKLIESPKCVGWVEELGQGSRKKYIGMYINREDDEKVSVGGFRQLGQAANAVHKQHKTEQGLHKDLAAKLERELKRHDWHAAFSDDSSVWRRAEAHMKKIKALMKRVDPEIGRNLWNQYSSNKTGDPYQGGFLYID